MFFINPVKLEKTDLKSDKCHYFRIEGSEYITVRTLSSFRQMYRVYNNMLQWGKTT